MKFLVQFGFSYNKNLTSVFVRCIYLLPSADVLLITCVSVMEGRFERGASGGLPSPIFCC